MRHLVDVRTSVRIRRHAQQVICVTTVVFRTSKIPNSYNFTQLTAINNLECYACHEGLNYDNYDCWTLKSGKVPTARCAGACFFYHLDPPRVDKPADRLTPIVRGCTFTAADRTRPSTQAKLLFDYDNYTKPENEFRARFCNTSKCNNFTFTQGSSDLQRNWKTVASSFVLLIQTKNELRFLNERYPEQHFFEFFSYVEMLTQKLFSQISSDN